MYFWNINQLVTDLRAGILPEYEKMKYFLAMTLLQFYALYNAHQFVPINSYEVLIQAFFFGILVGVIVWGIYHCFIINKQNDNKNFIERFVCLSFPLSVRFLLIIAAMLFAVIIMLFLGLSIFAPEKAALISSLGTKTNELGLSTQALGTLLRPVLLKLYVLHMTFFIIILIFYYIVLGRKIAEVSAK